MSLLGELVLLALGALLVLWIGWKQGFFHWKPESDWNRNIQLIHVVLGFVIYFIVAILAPSLYADFFQSLFPLPEAFIGYATWLNFSFSATILVALYILWRCLPHAIQHAIWRSPTAKQSYTKDLQMSAIGWFVAFPTVLFLNQLLEFFLYQIIGLEYIPDQIAVRFVKMAAQVPFYFFLAVTTVVIFAPLIEEFLFRGLLQSFARKYLGSKAAIVVAAFCFSFFHFSPEQGWGNLPIIVSLFPLALFLGFLYERQRSLCASIGMHSLFNLLSITNLYFMGGIPCA